MKRRWGIFRFDSAWRVVARAEGLTAGAWRPFTGRSHSLIAGDEQRIPASAIQELWLLAAADGVEEEARGARILAYFLEGELTQDKRMVDIGATNFERPTPLPLMRMIEEPEMGGHAGAVLCGAIDTLARVGADRIEARGYFYAGEGEVGQAAQEAEALVRDGVLTWWSPDFGAVEVVTEIIAQSEDGFPTDWIDHLTAGTLIGVTLCPKQALDSARVELEEAPSIDAPATPEEAPEEPADGEPAPGPQEEEEEARLLEAISAAAGPAAAPSEWFNDPQLEEPTPITITDEGRVFGHVAAWGVCHTGIENRCVMAPHSATDYAHFRTGAYRSSDGQEIPVGQLTMGCGHADLTLAAGPAAAHYDGGPGAIQWADVAAGEDAHGIWVAGALRPELSEEQIRQARALALSGDWRRRGGSLEMIAALSVPVPGFPIARAMAAGGFQIEEAPITRLFQKEGACEALVAAGIVNPSSARGEGDMGARVRALELALRREQLLRRVPARA